MRRNFDNWLKRGAAAVLALTLGAGIGSMALAKTADNAGNEVKAVEPGTGFEAVDSIPMLTRLHSWHALDDETVIVWATPFQPYLVKLAYPSHDLKFEQVIGLTSSGSRVYAKFDAVQVRGFRYPIDSIYKLTREEAKDLVRAS